MRVGPYLAVLVALLCLVHNTAADPEPEPEALKRGNVDTVPVGTRINPRFYFKVDRDEKRSLDSPVGAEEDELSPEEEAEISEEEEEEEDDNSIDGEDTIETYYPVSDDNGQTYLIPERVLQSMVEKQEANDESDTFLVPNGSVPLDDEESEDGENDSAIVLSEGEPDDNALVDGSQYIAIVQESDVYGKARRPARRAGVVRRRRVGGRRRRTRTRRGGSRKRLVRRRTRRKIRRGGGRRRGVRRGGSRGGGRVRLGRIRLRPQRRYGGGFRF